LSSAPAAQLDAVEIFRLIFGGRDASSNLGATMNYKLKQIIREIRDPAGKLTLLFVKDCNGLKMAVRLPR
jgi:hypothetical protein